ncbi:MAG TPA: SRPBCC family protein [Patescibacteria group bacterium]|nr:SRPBCC family protein [Patescibacteria group bacterium]
MKISNSIIINRPTADVFAFFKNVENYPCFSTAFKKVKLLFGDKLQPGARLLKTVEFLGVEQNVEQEVVEFELLKKIVFKNISGPIRGTETLLFKKLDDNKTELAIILDGEPEGFLKFGAGLLKRKADEQMQRDLLNLKGIME